MGKPLPRVEISISKIRENASFLARLYGTKGISLMGVTKAVLGEPKISEAMIHGGVRWIADSRLENIAKMRAQGLAARYVLLRTPLSSAESVVALADVSFNTELETLKSLSHRAHLQNIIHQVVIMVELGDLREGVLPTDLFSFVREVLTLPCLEVIGIGGNLACYGGVHPDEKNMAVLSELANQLERELPLRLELVSGGNSANYDWFRETKDFGRINNLRIGESILLGCETLSRKPISGLNVDAFQLVAEIIEAKTKPSMPYGQLGQDAFGVVKGFKDKGQMQRLILALGRQDVTVVGIQPTSPLEIIGASSDHVLLDGKNTDLQVGDEVRFSLDYGALLAVMTSPFVHKRYHA
ncbi:MAG: alanine/ornithine racemase family PLP-dependent enzyme [Deltaproteobacteria bacterium]|nr:alanine/ornithine racemase family PLP-dependent enzyme [Deltaproteobacteria bacterium]